MKKKRTDLPARSDINSTNDDVRYKHQDEFETAKPSSQEGNERMIEPEKKKQSEKWDKAKRKLPNLKK